MTRKAARIAFILALFSGLLIVHFFTGCSTAEIPPDERTLTNTGELPHEILRRVINRRNWLDLKDTPYDAFAIVHGVIEADGTISAREVEKAWPDETRNQYALNLTSQYTVSSRSVGSRIRPRAEIYVVFYETHFSPRRSVVFGRQIETIAPTESLRTYLRAQVLFY